MIALMVGLAGILLLLYQKKQQAYNRHLEDIKIKYEQEFLNSKIEIQEETLQHISREIHDNIGQYLSLAKLHLNTSLPTLGVEGEKVGWAIDLLTKALQELRDVSRNLRITAIQEAGLPKAIEDQIEHLRHTGQYTLSFDLLGNYEYMEDQKEVILFRILQEAISNIIRHARANEIKITLDCQQSGQVSMIITDDGVGFPAKDFVDNGGHKLGGIRNMLYRAKVLNAEFAIDSTPGQGTSVFICVPNEVSNV
jgi:signal transduction histidine kinase